MIAALVPCPPFPPLRPELYGEPVLMLVTVYSGPAAERRGIIAALDALGTPTLSHVGPAPWVQVNRMLDVIAPYGRRVHTRGGYLSDLSAPSIATMVKWAAKPPAPTSPAPSVVQNIWFMGGAISEDTAEDAMAFSRDGALVFWECVGQWDGPEHDAEYQAWVDGAADDLAPEMRANGYCNLTTDRGPAWLRGLYGSPQKWQRLVAAKRKWDPLNLLRYNKNIVS
jgi:hypothetical protein